MAAFTLRRSDLFPVGTTVGAYPLATRRTGQDMAPAGTATESQAVAADGTASFVALAADTDYVFYAKVGGEHRATTGRTKTATGTGSVVGAQGRGTATGTTTSGSTALTAVSAAAGALQVGQTIAGPGIPPGTLLVAGSGASWTLSQKATASGTGVALELDRGNAWRARLMRRRAAIGTT